MIGSVIDAKYLLTEKLGAGGAGTVYRAWNEQLARAVAVKILNSADLSSSDAQRKLVREARNLSQLNNQHIVSGSV